MTILERAREQLRGQFRVIADAVSQTGHTESQIDPLLKISAAIEAIEMEISREEDIEESDEE
jgi:hypothetical protein